MSELVTDPKDPRLGHGTDPAPTKQNAAYLILSEEERAKGFVRPVRRSYAHVGRQPRFPLRDLTEEEKERHTGCGYVKFEEYPESESPLVGRFWTQKDIDNRGCGSVTTMSQGIAETYARSPKFYGSTYCCGCQRHLPVEEFVWDGTTQTVGS